MRFYRACTHDIVQCTICTCTMYQLYFVCVFCRELRLKHVRLVREKKEMLAKVSIIIMMLCSISCFDFHYVLPLDS